MRPEIEIWIRFLAIGMLVALIYIGLLVFGPPILGIEPEPVWVIGAFVGMLHPAIHYVYRRGKADGLAEARAERAQKRRR